MIIIEHNGRRFAVKHEYDQDHGAPWEEADGHGVISNWTTRDKAPGERVLSVDRNSRRYYDMAATLKVARRDGWSVLDTAGKTKKQILAEAVEQDFEYCRAWANDEWQYIGVVVTLLDENDKPTQYQASLWGVESSSSDYVQQVERELADEALAEASNWDTCSTCHGTGRVKAGSNEALETITKERDALRRRYEGPTTSEES